MLSAAYRIYPIALNCQACCWLCKLCCCCSRCCAKKTLDNVPLLSVTDIHDQETGLDTETQQIFLDFAQPSTSTLENEASDGGTVLHAGILPTALVPEPTALSTTVLVSFETTAPSKTLSLETTALPATPTALPWVVTHDAATRGTQYDDTAYTATPTQPSSHPSVHPSVHPPVHGTWHLLPSEPHWEETVTMELDFSSHPQTTEIAQTDDDDDDTQAFSLQANLDQEGHEVIQHFILTEAGLVEQ